MTETATLIDPHTAEGIVQESANILIQEAIELRLELAEDDGRPCSYLEAFNEVCDLAEDHDGYRHLLRHVRRIEVLLGLAVPLDDDEIRETFRSRGPVWDFRMNNRPYRYVFSIEERARGWGFETEDDEE